MVGKILSYVFLAPGDKIMAVHRRLYEADKPRIFVAVVDAFDGGLLKATGFTLAPSKCSFTRKTEPRTKILSLTSGSLIVYQLPSHADLTSMRVTSKDKRLALVDDAKFSLDIGED